MSKHAPWYYYLPLLVFPFTLFAPIILSGRALFWGTPLTQFIPWWNFAWDEVTQGVLPLWNSMLGMGAPLVANYQSALFYPPTWLYYLLYSIGGVSSMAWFQAVMVVLHLIWASLGMALLIRQLRLGILAQVIAGLAFGLSGYLVSRAGFLSINAAVAWMPWIILGVTKLIAAYNGHWRTSSSEGNRRYKLLSAYLLLTVSIAMLLLAGHAQTAWYSLILASVWALYFTVTISRKNWRSVSSSEHEFIGINEVELGKGAPSSSVNQDNKEPSYPKVKTLLLVGTSLVLAIGIGAMQLLPTGEYLLQSQRSVAVDYEFAMSYSFWPWRFLSFIAPDLFGNPVIGDYWGYANYWEDAIYIGLIPFVLAIAALLTRGKKVQNRTMINSRFVGFLFILLLVSFTIALGRNTPIFPWLYRNLPTFDMFQAPTRISILGIFSLTILSAIGADSWHRPQGKHLYWLRLGVMAAAAITVGAGIALLVSRSLSWGIRPSFIRATAMLGFWGVGLGFLALKAPQKDIMGAANLNWGWWQWAVILWVGLDLIVAGWGLNPGVDLNVYSEPSPTEEQVSGLLDGGRMYLPAEDEKLLKFERFLRFDTFQPFSGEEGWQSLRATLLPNVTILDSIPSANNFDPLLPGRYSAWIEIMEEVDSDTKDQMLNLMNVTVVENIDLSEPYGVRFDSRDAYPRIRWVACGLLVENGDQALEKVTQNQVDFVNEVILEVEDASAEPFCSEYIATEINMNISGPSKLLLEVATPNPGYIVMADVWYPGWRAFVDGEPTPILHANYLFRAVALPSGEHEVIIAYQPKGFYWGAVISGLALVGLIILGASWFGKKRAATKK
jgi:hypothetical protein